MTEVVVITRAIRRAKRQSNPNLSLAVLTFFQWTWVSQCLLKQRMMEVVVTTGAKSRAKLQSNRHHQPTNTQLLTDRMPFLSPNQQCQSTERNKYHNPGICSTQAHLGVFQPSLWPLKAPGYLGGRVAKPRIIIIWYHKMKIEILEWLSERTEHLDIFLFSAHHSMVFYFRCSVYWWKGSVRF